jgi:SnoaL-like domain
MRIFVAGARDAVERCLVPRLVSSGRWDCRECPRSLVSCGSSAPSPCSPMRLTRTPFAAVVAARPDVIVHQVRGLDSAENRRAALKPIEIPMDMTALARWRDYVETRDDAALRNLLHPDVVFESPIMHTPNKGREITLKYLASAVRVLGGPKFRFTREWRNADSAVLELETEIDGIVINGVDIITFNDDGSLITHFKVMVRPFEAIKLLHRLMSAEVARA